MSFLLNLLVRKTANISLICDGYEWYIYENDQRLILELWKLPVMRINPKRLKKDDFHSSLRCLYILIEYLELDYKCFLMRIEYFSFVSLSRFIIFCSLFRFIIVGSLFTFIIVGSLFTFIIFGSLFRFIIFGSLFSFIIFGSLSRFIIINTVSYIVNSTF